MEVQKIVESLQQFDPSELSLLDKEIHKLQSRHIDNLIDFESGVYSIQKFLDRLTNEDEDAEAIFTKLQEQAQTLSYYVKEQSRYRRHLLAILQTAIRRISPETITSEQVYALHEVACQLSKQEPTYEDVLAARKELASSGISVLPTFGKHADKFVEIVKDDRKVE